MPSTASRYMVDGNVIWPKVPAFEGFEVQHVDLDPTLDYPDFCTSTSEASANVPNINDSDFYIVKTYDFEMDPVPLLRNSTENISITNSASASDAISPMDILITRLHILRTNYITDPFSLIAADMNESGHVSTYDNAQMRRRILGLPTPGIPIWKTMPLNQLWEDNGNRITLGRTAWGNDFINDPFSTASPAYPDYLKYGEMNYFRTSAQTYDQKAALYENGVCTIKMGDVNNSFDAIPKSGFVDTLYDALADTFYLFDPVEDYGLYRATLNVTNNTTTQGGITSRTIEVGFDGTADNILGFNFEIEIDSGFSISNVDFSATTIDDLGIDTSTVLYNITGGVTFNVLILFQDTSGVDIDNEPLFTFDLTAPTATENTGITVNEYEVISGKQNETLALHWSDASTPAIEQDHNEFMLMSNIIESRYGKHIDAWRIYNSSGQLINTDKGQRYQTQLDLKSTLSGNPSGIYMIELRAGDRIEYLKYPHINN